MLRKELNLWPFSQKLYYGWISTMTSSNESSWKLHPPKWRARCAPVIDTLSEKKGTHQNDIPVKSLKLSNKILSPFLAKLFNNCINQGVYPQNFKCVQVTPIHKSALSAGFRGEQGARAQGPPPKGATHHVHAFSYTCDMCVPLRHFTEESVFVDAIVCISLEYYFILWRNHYYTYWFPESRSGIWI